MNVDCYFNAHRKNFSIRDRKAARVVGHHHEVIVENALFVVSRAGRARVLRERKKNVHAYVRGTMASNYDPVTAPKGVKWRQATYDPYLYETFVDSLTGKRLASAKTVRLRIEDGHAQIYYEPW